MRLQYHDILVTLEQELPGAFKKNFKPACTQKDFDMRICRYNDDRVGVIRGDQVFDATLALESLPQYTWPLPLGDPFIAALDSLRPALEAAADQSTPRAMDDVTLLSPVANPTKIVGAPVNYQKHMDEVADDKQLHHGTQIKPIEKLGLFLKSASSLVGAAHGVDLRFLDRRNDHEIELAVVIGKPSDKVSRDEALHHVAGYSIGLDMTVRGSEERSMRKSIDSYSVLGPCLVTADEIPEPGRLGLNITVNGEVRQSSNTAQLIFDVPRLIELATSFYTLYPGDIIMTGTPDGVGPILPGDLMVASIESIGSMSVGVRAG